MYKPLFIENYPTKDEILNPLMPIKREVLVVIKNWKKSVWRSARRGGEYDKFVALKTLVEEVSGVYNNPFNDVVYAPGPGTSFYRPGNRTITMTNSSIITVLHELAHHLFGDSELQACRWSVSIFIKTFPQAYERLEWDRHMLVRRRESAGDSVDAEDLYMMLQNIEDEVI